MLSSPYIQQRFRRAGITKVKYLRMVKACLDLLVPLLHLYIDSQDSGSKVFCNVSLHGPFYASCQAVFYTLIFRHKAILEGSMKKECLILIGQKSLNLERIVMRQLNPLKVCLPAITNMFAAIMRSRQYFESIYQVWEEPSDCMAAPKKEVTKNSTEEEDDFLHGETPKADTVMGSYESHLRSPSSVGSPPIAFLQRPF
ncbi:hypothetical protein QTP86_005262 [Hemibagrus guttatus]|nr:hypothetical protein QTP86_005262 [Hemibagrus guttatus]